MALPWNRSCTRPVRHRLQPAIIRAISYPPPRPTRLLRGRPSPAGSPRLTPTWSTVLNQPSAPSAPSDHPPFKPESAPSSPSILRTAADKSNTARTTWSQPSTHPAPRHESTVRVRPRAVVTRPSRLRFSFSPQAYPSRKLAAAASAPRGGTALGGKPAEASPSLRGRLRRGE